MVNYHASFEEDCFYHLYNRSNNKEIIFRSDENYRFFLQRWKHYLLPYLDTYFYALIPNHFHFVVRVRPFDKYNIQKEQTTASRNLLERKITYNTFLEDQMKRFFSSYAKAFNKQYGRNGSVFQKRFKRIALRDEEHVKYLIAYHHHNPIYHGLAENFKTWKYTSHNAILTEVKTHISRTEVLQLFDGREDFIRYHWQFKMDKRMEFLALE